MLSTLVPSFTATEIVAHRSSWIPAYITDALSNPDNAHCLRLLPSLCHSMDRRIAVQLTDNPPNMDTLEPCDLRAGDILIAETHCKPKDGELSFLLDRGTGRVHLALGKAEGEPEWDKWGADARPVRLFDGWTDEDVTLCRWENLGRVIDHRKVRPENVPPGGATRPVYIAGFLTSRLMDASMEPLCACTGLISFDPEAQPKDGDIVLACVTKTKFIPKPHSWQLGKMREWRRSQELADSFGFTIRRFRRNADGTIVLTAETSGWPIWIAGHRGDYVREIDVLGVRVIGLPASI